MKKASEYRQHATECRYLAGKMELGDPREQLLAMARHWDRLAGERKDMIARHPELALEGESDEEAAAGAVR